MCGLHAVICHKRRFLLTCKYINYVVYWHFHNCSACLCIYIYPRSHTISVCSLLTYLYLYATKHTVWLQPRVHWNVFHLNYAWEVYILYLISCILLNKQGQHLLHRVFLGGYTTGIKYNNLLAVTRDIELNCIGVQSV